MKKLLNYSLILVVLILGMAVTEGGCVITPSGLKHYTYDIVAEYPHDSDAFTQGLVFENGYLYESTGLYGESTLRKVVIATGTPDQMVSTPDMECAKKAPEQVFGEGITIWDDTIVQLTWQCERGVVYNKSTFAEIDQFTYDTEGWGITHDGSQLIVSDGTHVLQFWDPDTFERTGVLSVLEGSSPVTNLNELEYIEGLIYANIWYSTDIVMIDPDTGQVKGRIHLDGLNPNKKQSGAVLNGIAYDEANDRLYVTGKLWTKLFEIDLVLQPSE